MSDFFSYLSLDFGLYALVGGIFLSLMTGSLGCFLMWKRMVFYGDALAHTAFLAVAMALLTPIPLLIMILLICLGVSYILSISHKFSAVPVESWLGAISYGSLACGLVFLSISPNPAIDAQSILFGDLLSITMQECIYLALGVVVTCSVMLKCWRQWLLITVSPDLAQSRNINLTLNNFLFLTLLALTVALGLKIVGALLVPALLILPPSIARPWAKNAKHMIGISCSISVLSIFLGLGGAFQMNTPPSATIILINLVLFLCSGGLIALGNRVHRRLRQDKGEAI